MSPPCAHLTTHPWNSSSGWCCTFVLGTCVSHWNASPVPLVFSRFVPLPSPSPVQCLRSMSPTSHWCPTTRFILEAATTVMRWSTPCLQMTAILSSELSVTELCGAYSCDSHSPPPTLASSRKVSRRLSSPKKARARQTNIEVCLPQMTVHIRTVVLSITSSPSLRPSRCANRQRLGLCNQRAQEGFLLCHVGPTKVPGHLFCGCQLAACSETNAVQVATRTLPLSKHGRGLQPMTVLGTAHDESTNKDQHVCSAFKCGMRKFVVACPKPRKNPSHDDASEF